MYSLHPSLSTLRLLLRSFTPLTLPAAQYLSSYTVVATVRSSKKLQSLVRRSFTLMAIAGKQPKPNFDKLSINSVQVYKYSI